MGVSNIIVCIPVYHKLHIAMLRELMNSLFLYCDASDFDVLLLLNEQTVTPVMRLRTIDSFNYKVSLDSARKNYATIKKYKYAIFLRVNVLVQDNIKTIMTDEFIKPLTVYKDNEKDATITICRPFFGMFDAPKRQVNKSMIDAKMAYVMDINSCYVDKMFLCFKGERTDYKKFMKNYFEKLILNKCKA